MDPRGVGSVTVELNNTAAQLRAKLCVELDTDDATGVMSRALGLLEMCMRTKRQGGRLCFVNERDEVSDVVF
jgi:pimeloyl-CoA synthetase